MILLFGHIFVAFFALILQIYLHISKFCSNFAPANSRWGVCIDVTSEGADILTSITIISRLPKLRNLYKSEIILEIHRNQHQMQVMFTLSVGFLYLVEVS